MREIIFRGIRLDTKEFTYGYLWAKITARLVQEH